MPGVFRRTSGPERLIIMEWNIQSRAHECRSCDREFTDKQTYHTLLFDARASYERIDVCEDCWKEQYSHGTNDRKGFISHWQGVYEKPQPQPEPIQKENAESLLRKLAERGDARFGPSIYILAVMLERKRLLKVKEQLQSEDKRIFVYEHPKSGDVFTVMDPQLRLDQLEQVQKDVARLLEHGPDADLSVDLESELVQTDSADADDPGDAADKGADSAAESPEPAPLTTPESPCRT